MFRANVLTVRRAKIVLYCLWYHHTYRLPSRAQVERTLSQSVHGTATYMCDDTRHCIVKFCPPDEKHICSKHVEAWNKLIIKFSASSWLILINNCFRRFFRPSSGAKNCTYSVRYLSDHYCYLLLAAGSSNGLTNTWRCMCSFELLMTDAKTVWNMQSVLQK